MQFHLQVQGPTGSQALAIDAASEAEAIRAAVRGGWRVLAVDDGCVQDAGVALQTATVESHAVWRGILQAADSGDADLIVMGSHGRSGIEKLVLGSVAHKVVTNTRLPVLLVRS